ncbi:unnamed protein product [Diatraea saccharalis]|uniref:Uncharacterized protein n=1 Tax=Diatraea saccharalis TaxID=40085 RepID=A0A9N9N0J9_9NEOP|nr:unnamed protein product [Diatraea saccharalis]
MSLTEDEATEVIEDDIREPAEATMSATANTATDYIEQELLRDIFGSSPVEPYEDSGSEYVPEQGSKSSSRSLRDILGDSSGSEGNDEGLSSVSTSKDTRKRIRKENLWKKNVRKNKRARGNFDLQSAYLYSLIHVMVKARSYVRAKDTSSERVAGNTTSKPKEFSRLYHLPEANGKHIRVCKSFFKQVFKVSDGRLTRVLKNKPLGDPAPIDKRGRHIPSNKTPDTKVNEVKDFINTFPKYDSHYTRHKSETRQYLPPHLNLSIMYSEYKSDSADLTGGGSIAMHIRGGRYRRDLRGTAVPQAPPPPRMGPSRLRAPSMTAHIDSRA